MYMLYDKILVVRSANSVLLFKRCHDEDHYDNMGEKMIEKWEEYHMFDDLRGQISF